MAYTEQQAREGKNIQDNAIAPERRDRFIPVEMRAPEPEPEQATHNSGETRRTEEAGLDSDGFSSIPEYRDPDDRREILFSVICFTSGSIDTIEDWLDDNCEDEWRVVLQGVGEDLTRKKLNVMFKAKVDRAKFDNYFHKTSENS
ncbi:MAG: hypothetical protein HQ494_09505 [Rhodospirillales bacterium]|nr:hypothetical protein [Rhodospirillales bacterium]